MEQYLANLEKWDKVIAVLLFIAVSAWATVLVLIVDSLLSSGVTL